MGLFSSCCTPKYCEPSYCTKPYSCKANRCCDCIDYSYEQRRNLDKVNAIRRDIDSQGQWVVFSYRRRPRATHVALISHMTTNDISTYGSGVSFNLKFDDGFTYDGDGSLLPDSSIDLLTISEDYTHKPKYFRSLDDAVQEVHTYHTNNGGSTHGAVKVPTGKAKAKPRAKKVK